ncbi:hypothetical protein GGF32_008324, partial [Allomyces javanicus]
AMQIVSVGGYKSMVPNLLFYRYSPPHTLQYTLRHLSLNQLDRDLLMRLKTATIDVTVGSLERLSRFTKMMAQQERDCRTGESNALYADTAMDHVDPYHGSSTSRSPI